MSASTGVWTQAKIGVLRNDIGNRNLELAIRRYDPVSVCSSATANAASVDGLAAFAVRNVDEFWLFLRNNVTPRIISPAIKTGSKMRFNLCMAEAVA